MRTGRFRHASVCSQQREVQIGPGSGQVGIGGNSRATPSSLAIFSATPWLPSPIYLVTLLTRAAFKSFYVMKKLTRKPLLIESRKSPVDYDSLVGCRKLYLSTFMMAHETFVIMVRGSVYDGKAAYFSCCNVDGCCRAHMDGRTRLTSLCNKFLKRCSKFHDISSLNET